MDWERCERAWPLVCVLACLLVFCVIWPGGLDEVAPVDSTGSHTSGPTDLSATLPTDSPPLVGKGDPQFGRAALAPALDSRPSPASPWSRRSGQSVDKVTGYRLAEPAGKLASCPIELDWPDPEVATLVLTGRQPAVYEEAGPPLPKSSAAQEAPLAEPTPGDWPPPVKRLPPVEVSSADGSLRASDILSTLDRIVAQAEQHETGKAWDSPLPEPVALVERLEAIAWDCETGPWARGVMRHVRELGSSWRRGSDQEIRSVIGRLDALDREAKSLAVQLDDHPLAAKLRQAEDALARRVAIWSLVLEDGLSTPVHDPGDVDARQLLLALAPIDEIEGDAAVVQAWREYLELDPLQSVLAGPAAGDPGARQTAVRRTLKRLTSTRLTAEQREFLSGEPFVELRAQLRRCGAEAVDLAGVLEHLEDYERTGAPSEARLIAEDCLLLGLSSDPVQWELAQRLQTHYESANVRIAITGELLERMLPDPEPEVQWVHDRVMGKPVRGRSVTSANVGVRMIPDPSRLRAALEIEGLVSALTQSTAGPATFYNDSRSTYRAAKEVEFGTEGLRFHPAEVTVDNDTRLRSLRTSLDPIPLVGAVAQEIAQSQHEKSQPLIREEVEQKVADRAKRQIDEEVDARLGDANERLKSRVLEPLEALWLGPTMVSAETSQCRLTTRLRLASDEQLAAHTPRPWAPSDSLASCQVHESAVNNVIQQIGLDGGTFTLAEVRCRVAEAFNWPELIEEDPGREDVRITFADEDAVCVRCQDERVCVTLSIARLSKSPNVWTDFQVRAYYRPETDGASAQLVRDGIVELFARQSLRSQIALRGIFSGTFSKQRPWQLTPERLARDPRMADLGITQFEIDDGWIAVALGPRRADSQPVVAQRDGASVD